MPNIIIAKNSGFCPGVKRAIDQVLELSKRTGKKIYTLGPLIHNKEVIKKLEENNIFAVNSPSQIKQENAILVIRAHGIDPKLESEIRSMKLEIVDGTCSLVKLVHRNISQYREKGYTTVIVGDKDHAEVLGLKGYAGENSFVISNPLEAEKLPEMDKVNIVSQTTQEEDVFFACVKVLRKKAKELVVSNTICNPTRLRQRETLEMSAGSDLVIVVGGKHSANTTRLYEICSRLAKKTELIEKPEDLNENLLYSKQNIFITAGASTPNWLIEAVAAKVRKTVFPDKKGIELWNYFLDSGAHTGLAAGFFTLSCAKFLDVYGLPKKMVFASATFVLSLHILNRAVSKNHNASTRNSTFTKITAYTSAGISLLLILFSNVKLFFICSVMWFFGFTYSSSHKAYLRNLPGSKEAAVALGWAFACAILPIMNLRASFNKEEFLFCLFAFFAALTRSVLLSISQSKNDLLVGKESLYKLLGHPRTSYILSIFTLASLVSLYFATGKAELNLWAFSFFIYQFLLIGMFSIGKIPDKLNSEALTDLIFILMGLSATFVKAPKIYF